MEGDGRGADQVALAPAHRHAVLVHHFGRHAGRGPAQRARLERLNGQREQEAAHDLGAARDIDDGAAPPADALEEPEPGRLVPRLAGRARAGAATSMGGRSPPDLAQHADGGGRNAEGGDAVALDHLPQAHRARDNRARRRTGRWCRRTGDCPGWSTGPSSSRCRRARRSGRRRGGRSPARSPCPFAPGSRHGCGPCLWACPWCRKCRG